MNTHIQERTTLPHVQTQTATPTPLDFARALVAHDPWLAHRPELMRPDPIQWRAWPRHAVEPFNQTLITHRVAMIGTALRDAFADAPQVVADVNKGRFHALLKRHEIQPLTGDAREIARTLHEGMVTFPHGRDHVGLDDYLDMRPHAFGIRHRALSARIRDWAEHGVGLEGFRRDGGGADDYAI